MFGSRGSIGLLTDIGHCVLKNLSTILQFRYQRVQCLRVGNAEIPDDKQLRFALQHIRGIGRQRAHQILIDLSLENKRTKDLTGLELHTLRNEVSKYLIGEELTRCVRSDIQRLADIQCYRGYNHACLLPCRGQLTRTNARTRKGMRTLERSNWDGHQSLAVRTQKH
ncbi:small ribosomal subunit protein S13, mitochondrial-like isoform X1 [Ricinus communis]|uniref:small ribosomal subunit protein S13, mitochondrial-like isoform X1 n=1 Tax=Ricinus communis TaxID=3988 RepID=UPI0007721D21|nr:small ribosomal subunit protein S13, mitochondrial-like isoform X1 [Ricinus communis]|eukprot:XP_015571463.1 small ribosomal subunit protein S13, mitochondrial-like isoform X1 [Ricinus communis]